VVSSQHSTAHWGEIIGTRGTIRWDYYKSSVVYSQEQSAESARLTTLQISEIRNQMFLDEMQHFLDVLRNKEQSVCSLEDGVRSLELALAVHSSARQGKIVYF
jgi:predicted dehydrogenase